jgi:hypothetical protein
MIRPWFRQAAGTVEDNSPTQTRASGENRVSTKLGVLQLVHVLGEAGTYQAEIALVLADLTETRFQRVIKPVAGAPGLSAPGVVPTPLAI